MRKIIIISLLIFIGGVLFNLRPVNPHYPQATITIQPTETALSKVSINISNFTHGENAELFILMKKTNSLQIKKTVKPIKKGYYEFFVLLPVKGIWTFYLHYGYGQEGYTSQFRSFIHQSTPTIFYRPFLNGFKNEKDRNIQTLGYLLFFEIALCSLLFVFFVIKKARKEI